MKKLVVLMALMVSIVSCKQEAKVDYVLFSGKIENPKSEKITIYSGSTKVKEIAVNESGEFSDTLTIKSGYYSFAHAERSSFYASPGDEIVLAVNTAEFDETVTYSGYGSEKSNYMAAKYLTDEKMSGDFAKVYAMEETAFLEKVNEIKDAKVKLLSDTQKIDSNFRSLETKNLDFEHLLNLQRYQVYHEYYAKKDGFVPSKSFLKVLEDVDYDNAEYYANLSNYQSLVKGHYSTKLKGSNNPSEVFDEISKNASAQLKDDLAASLKFDVAPNNLHNEAYYNGLMALSSDDEFKVYLTDKYSKVKLLAKGMPSPVFNDYENHSGGTTSLSDLKGKYVYIDIWATWCGPCLREVPDLKRVESEYHNKNIEFVSVSVDRGSDYEKWTKMVNDKELGGEQLFADRTFKGGAIAKIPTKFIRDYAIEGIPRFILIDPEGNIVSGDAPRPSNPKLVAMFEELGI